MPLEQHYSGDKAFTCFASTPDAALDTQLGKWRDKAKLVELCGGNPLLARAVFYAASTYAIEYMSRAIPALDGLTPVECLKTDWGTKRLKECLMRSP